MSLRIIHNPRGHLGILNKELLRQIESSGVDVEILLHDTRRIGARRANPLQRLFEKKKLTREEYVAATRYQFDFELSNLSHHARPSYDGSSISAAASRASENTPKQSQLNATARVELVKRLVSVASRPHQIDGFKEFKSPHAKKFSRDLRLIEILELIFEKQITIREVETRLGINHSELPARIKKICEILLDM